MRASQKVVILNSGGAFSPTQIPGLQLWMDSSDASTLWQDAAGTIAADVGDPVGRWNDKSVNANHATQATAGKRPLRQAGGIVFDGTDDVITTALATLSEFTAFFAYSSYTSNTILGDDSGLSSSPLQRNNQIWFHASINQVNTSQNMSDNNIFVMVANYTSNEYSVIMDGELVGSDSLARTNPGGNLLFGAYAGVQEFLTASLQEIIIYSSVLSDDKKTDAGNYLSAKWGHAWAGL